MKNKFIATLIFIFVPTFVSLTLTWVDQEFNINDCWITAEEYKTQLDATEQYDVETSDSEKKQFLSSQDDYHFSEESSNDSTSNLTRSAKEKEIVNYVLKFVGKKYVFGGGHSNTILEKAYSKKDGGVDCSSFTSLVYKHFDDSIPTSSSAQRSVGKSVPYSKTQAGDIMVYSGHVAIFMGDGNKIAHASNSQAYPKGVSKLRIM